MPDSSPSDEKLLAQLGLRQVFRRKLNHFTNFCISFSCSCAPGTIAGTLTLTWNSGGPAASVHAWMTSAVASCALALSMAEICSALPTCGGPYYWSSVLGRKRGPLLGWFTGWFSFVGEAALAGAYAASLAQLLGNLTQVNLGVVLAPAHQLGIYTGCLILSGAVASLPATLLAHVSAWSCWWIFCGFVLVALTLPTVAPWHQSAHFIFAHLSGQNDSYIGVRGKAYLFLDNCMLATYGIIGWDACAHMSEETTGAQTSVPRAMIAALVTSSTLGYIFLISLFVSIQNPSTLMTGKADGNVAAQIFYDAFEARYGDGRVGTIMLAALPGSAVLVACMMVVLTGSRMIYSFARSGGIPCSAFFSAVNRRTHTPIRTVWLLIFIAFLIGLPLLKSQQAFGAVTEMAYVALLISFAIPITCRHTYCRDHFAHGPFTLGRWSWPIGWFGVAWTALAVVLFNCPSAYPVDSTTDEWIFDYVAPLILFGVFIGCLVSWHFPFGYGAKHWYTGPQLPSQVAAAMHAKALRRGMTIQPGAAKGKRG